MFKEALYYKKLAEKKVHCNLCPHSCIIENGEVGKCDVRQNVDGSLKSMLYGKPYISRYQPIEQFNLYHVLAGEQSFALGIAGNNIYLKDEKKEDVFKIPNIEQLPGHVLKQAEKTGCKVIVFGYGEPITYYEYVKDISEKQNQIKKAILTNCFINTQPIQELAKKINAASIEIKSMNNDIYEKLYGIKNEDILKAIKEMKNNGVWIEINLRIIPQIHESLYDIRKIISWTISELGIDTPLHFISSNGEKDAELLKKARKIAMLAGMNYVYTHGINSLEGETTYCPSCNKPVIIRRNETIENKTNKGKCSCGTEIKGIWE
ncbi:MAG: radical SAM protein [Candidatus Pacearchaeota archaeon]|jgi:pyruvate formate lyase activating enzyme